jgi:hypothetical protein
MYFAGLIVDANNNGSALRVAESNHLNAEFVGVVDSFLELDGGRFALSDNLFYVADGHSVTSSVRYVSKFSIFDFRLYYFLGGDYYSKKMLISDFRLLIDNCWTFVCF